MVVGEPQTLGSSCLALVQENHSKVMFASLERKIGYGINTRKSGKMSVKFSLETVYVETPNGKVFLGPDLVQIANRNFPKN